MFNEQERHQLVSILESAEFFSYLSGDEKGKLLNLFEKKAVGRGRVVIHEGKRPGDTFYFIASGRVTIWISRGFWRKVFVHTLEENDYFGEIALLTDQPRMATVITEEKCEFFELKREHFKKILSGNPALKEKLEKMAQERVERAELERDKDQELGLAKSWIIYRIRKLLGVD